MKPLVDLLQYTLKPGCKWFSQASPDADEGWYGPYQTIEQAFIACLSDELTDVVYVGQGRKLTKKEAEEWGCDFTWQVDTQNLIQVKESMLFVKEKHS